MPDDGTSDRDFPPAATRGVPIHAVGTPIYDATVGALVPTGDQNQNQEHDQDQGQDHAGDLAAVAQYSYTPPPDPTPELAPCSPADAAIHKLVHRLRDIPHRDGQWDHDAVLQQLRAWLAEDSGIRPSHPPVDAEHELRSALAGSSENRPGTGATFMVRIATEHHDPAPIVRADLTSLARSLGARTAIDLISRTGDQITRIEQYPFPTPGT